MSSTDFASIEMQEAQPSLFPDLGPVPDGSTGILPDQGIAAAIAAGHITAAVPIDESQIQPASLDLRLGPIGYRVRASFLPRAGVTVLESIEELSGDPIDLRPGCVLEAESVYIVPLLEELRLPHDMEGVANPKSSTGRLDVFTRLITEKEPLFDTVSNGYHGPLYLEISPRTFGIRVRQGTRLNQLRFSRGGDPSHSDRDLRALHNEEGGIVFGHDESRLRAKIDEGLWLDVDLRGDKSSGVIGYRGKRHCPPIDLEKIGHYRVADYWEPIRASAAGQLLLDPDEFYILVSKRRVRIPTGVAAEMVPIDPAFGEFRVHYAGFFDPGFGCGTHGMGTPAVLEVRSHEVPFMLNDGQVVARLIYKRLAAAPKKAYGAGIGSSYQTQGLALSKHFAPAE